MFEHLPGGNILQAGLADLEAGVQSTSALLLLIAGPRLREKGFRIPVHADSQISAEELLYDALVRQFGRAAFMQYNALLREIVSLQNALDVTV